MRLAINYWREKLAGRAGTATGYTDQLQLSANFFACLDFFLYRSSVVSYFAVKQIVYSQRTRMN